MSSEENDIALSMSEINRLSKDVYSFMHALATRLSSSLPAGMLKVTKKKKLFSSREIVESITITIKDNTFAIFIENDNIVTTINKYVNNIVLSHQRCSVPEWFAYLKEELKSMADYHKDAAELLSDFLI